MPMKYKRKGAYWQKFVDEVLNDIDNQGFFRRIYIYKYQSCRMALYRIKNKLVDYSDDAIFENGKTASASRLPSGSWNWISLIISTCMMG